MKRGVERIEAANTVNYSLSNLDALVEVAAEEGYIAAANTVNYSLSNLDALVEVAAEEGYIAPEWKERILAFRNNPSDESWIK